MHTMRLVDPLDVETPQELQELYRREQVELARRSLERCILDLEAERERRPMRGWLSWRPVRGQA